jgi:hypothetical protein
MKSFKQFINEQLSFDDFDDFEDFGDDDNIFPDSLSNLKKLSKEDIYLFKNLITSGLEYDNVLAEAGLNSEGVAVEDFIGFFFPEVHIFIEFLKRTVKPSPVPDQAFEVSNTVNSLNIIQNLKELDLSRIYDGDGRVSDDRLIELPAGYIHLQKLTNLNLNATKLKEFPIEILKNNKGLIYLDLRGNQLDEFPKEIGQLQKLEVLDLSYNNLVELPKEIGQLQNLVILRLGNNNLVELPKEIGKLQNLIELHIDHNQLKELPKEIGYLYNLKTIRAIWNKLTSLPHDALKNLPKLNIVDLYKNLIPKEQLDLLRDKLPHCKIYPQ